MAGWSRKQRQRQRPKAILGSSAAVGARDAGTSPPPVVSETERLQMLNEISRALTSRLDLREVYDTIYEQISQVMDKSSSSWRYGLKSRIKSTLPTCASLGAIDGRDDAHGPERDRSRPPRGTVPTF